MGMVVNYVCDVTGKSSTNKEDFAEVTIGANGFYASTQYGTVNGYATLGGQSITKLVHRDVALKLNLIVPKKDEPEQPEVTFESKLSTLLKDYIEGLVADTVSEEVSNALSNR